MSTASPVAWKRAFDVQMATWRWYRSERGSGFLARHFMNEAAHHERTTRELMENLYASEVNRTLGADPIYVSREMCEVVSAAAGGFQPEPLLLTDLVTEAGFIVYEEAFDIPDRYDNPTTIAAVSWTPMIAFEEKLTREQRDEMSSEVALTRWRENAELGERAGAGGVALSIYAVTPDEMRATGVPPVLLMHLTPWYFNMTFEGNELDLDGRPTGAGWWWRVVQTTFRLMKQRIAVRHTERLDRGRRREAQRIKFPEREVLVVRLRRERSRWNEPSGEEANYSHRFIVNGHWRNQWYPSLGQHRQIWISPYVKGPPDKELVVKPRRAYVWDR